MTERDAVWQDVLRERKENVMDETTPHLRRRGMFFPVETPELDEFEHESAEGIAVRAPSRKASHPSRSTSRNASSQINDRDWQPSTGNDEPLIQLARGDARNATAAATSSGRPKRPKGSSLRMNSAIASGSAF